MPANNTNIPSYSAADLLRYATGGMSAPEMHQLEKAALEDPFLAEALEGYMEAATENEIPYLQKKIEQLPPVYEEKRETRIIPLWRKKAVQIAIAASVLLGGGWWVLSLLNTPKNDTQTTAKTYEQPLPSSLAADSTASKDIAAVTEMADKPQIKDSQFTSPAFAQVEKEDNNAPATLQQEKQESAVPTVAQSSDSVFFNNEIAANQPMKEEKAAAKMMRVNVDTDALSKNSNNKINSDGKADEYDNVFAKRKASPVQYFFKGKLVDAQNNPLPYASVVITGIGVGTYTNNAGSFNLISADSTLTVSTRSLGYVSQNFSLKPGNQETKIVLQEDEKLKSNIVVTQTERQQRTYNFRPTIVEKDSLEGSVKPAIGFNDYNLYLANNNRLNNLQQLGKQVQLSFDVSKTGEITNITVVQSSGEAIDQEAIRLLKEGPKWTGKKGKKGKITLKF